MVLYPLAGSECLVIHKHNTFINFSGAIPGDSLHKRELVDVITWIITKDEEHILIKIVGAVDNTSNNSQETLLSPTHIRAGGHYVNDIQERHGGKELVVQMASTCPYHQTEYTYNIDATSHLEVMRMVTYCW